MSDEDVKQNDIVDSLVNYVDEDTNTNFDSTDPADISSLINQVANDNNTNIDNNVVANAANL